MIFAGSISNSSDRRVDSLHERHVRRPEAEVAEVDRERRLRRSGDADEHDVRLGQAADHPVVVLDGELDRLHAPEVRLVELVAAAWLHRRGHARDLRDGLDRLAEQVAVVQARTPAERPHLLAQLGLDERVDDDRGPTLRALDRVLEVDDALDHRVANLLERLIRELGLQRVHEAGRGLPGRIGDDVELYGLWAHRAQGIAVPRRTPLCGLSVRRPTRLRLPTEIGGRKRLRPAVPRSEAKAAQCRKRRVATATHGEYSGVFGLFLHASFGNASTEG